MNHSQQKTAATGFLTLVGSNKIDEAYDMYVGPNFRHHNAYFPGDAASLRRGMQESAERFPKKKLVIQRAIEEGDTVVVHSSMCPQQGMPTMALVHIFRFENGRIAELWDVGQPEPETQVNELGMF